MWLQEVTNGSRRFIVLGCSRQSGVKIEDPRPMKLYDKGFSGEETDEYSGTPRVEWAFSMRTSSEW